MILLALWALLPIALCFLCSLLEATLLSIAVPSLIRLQRQGSKGASWLLYIKKNMMYEAITAILTINTFAATIGAGFLGAEASHIVGAEYVGAFTVGLTVSLLVISEIIPKTYAATHPSRLAAASGSILRLCIFILSPWLFVTKGIAKLFGAGNAERLGRRDFVAMIDSAPAEGTITAPTAEILSHMIYTQDITVGEICTGISTVFYMDEDSPIGEMLNRPEADAFSRIPLVRGKSRSIVGYVAQREILKAISIGEDKTCPMKEFSIPIPRISSLQSVQRATEILLEAHDAMALVVDETNEQKGIVTLEDLFEVMLGIDITDEPEEIARLRQSAHDIRRSRLARIRKMKGKWSAGSDR